MSIRLFVLAVLSIAAVLYAPIHYTWRWKRNDQLFRDRRIVKDDWAADQIFIPVEAWGLRAAGVCGAGFVVWTIVKRRTNAA
jgi:hypothetical protein